MKMKKNKAGVPHRARFGVSFDAFLHEAIKRAATSDRRSVSNWLEMAAREFLGCATPEGGK
jgi:hypothetical protein